MRTKEYDKINRFMRRGIYNKTNFNRKNWTDYFKNYLKVEQIINRE